MTALLLAALWTCHTVPHFRICTEGPLNDITLDTRAPQSLARNLRLLGARSYPHPIALYIVRSYSHLQELTGAYGKGTARPEEHAIYLVAGHLDELDHELNHEVATGLWGKSEFWIAEGLAAYAADPGRIDARCRKVLADRWSETLAGMVTPTWNAGDDPYPASVIYPMLGSFVKYLRTAYGLDRLRRVWKGGSASIPAVYGKPLDALDREWRAALAGR